MNIPQSNYDFAQVLKAVLDEPSAALRVLITGLNLSISANDDSIKMAGSEDGSATGTPSYIVNTIRQNVLATKDLVESYTWADFGTKQERVTQINYTSSTFPGVTVTKNFSYSMVNLQYQLDTVTWSVSV